ncbi:MAG: hypothetical protein AB1801_22445, partial [Chloroflexota bacterium]
SYFNQHPQSRYNYTQKQNMGEIAHIHMGKITHNQFWQDNAARLACRWQPANGVSSTNTVLENKLFRYLTSKSRRGIIVIR